jgi:hypothetical protein
MPGAITKSKPNTRSRRLSGEKRPMQRPIGIGIVSATKAGSVLTIVFNQAVSLKGVPQYTTNLAVTPVSAALTSPTTLAVTFSGAVTTATTLNVPVADPAIRNTSGGYANAGSFPVA